MIIVKLKGGLGNQMFQYAMGRRIACINELSVKFDLSWFENVGYDTLREYELKHFRIHEEIATKAEIERFINDTYIKNKIRRLQNKLVPLKWRSLVTERKTGFDKGMMQLRDNIYLDGFWGNEKYFIDIREILLEEFQLFNPSDEVNMKLAEQIGTCNSVAVHIRRGDYVTNPITYKYHGLCSLDYYERAISEISKTTEDPHFFMFSDDPRWVKENIKTNYPTTYITHNTPAQGHEDLNLMFKCKHNIIANSSFSWWGAWLNINPNKIVYAPSRWANNFSVNTRGFLPENWITL